MARRVSGPLLAVLALVPMIGSAQDPATLRDAERAFGERVRAAGLAAAVAGSAAPDLVLVYPGAPVVVGRERAQALLEAEPLPDSLVPILGPTDSWVSVDEALGVTQGSFATGSRRGTYIMGWRRDEGEWRLIGLMLAGLPAVAHSGDPMELPALDSSGPTAGIVEADLAFSAQAGLTGAADAFRSYAAPDAVVLGAQGPQRGPEAIGASIGRGPAADWSWAPVAARIAPSGDLGFTVGQAVIRPRDGGDAVFSKYLTVWRRQPDGSMRFLTDGGNARPRP